MKNIFSMIATCLMIGSTANAQIIGSETKRIENTHSTTTKTIVVDENKNYNRIYWGYAALKFKTKYKGKSSTGDAIHGFDIGWTGGYNITKKKLPMYIEAGANFAMHFHIGGWDYLAGEVPINFTYRYKIGRSKVRIAPYFGPHLKMHVRYEGTTDEKIACFGIQLGVNIDINHFYMGAGWDKDLTPWSDKGDFKTTTGGARVNIGVTF